MKKAILFLMAVISVLGLTGCKQQTAEKEFINSDQYGELYANADTLKGKYVELMGRVYSAQKEDRGYTIQMFTDPMNASGNTLIMYYNTDNVISEGDYIKVSGMIWGAYKGVNNGGADVVAPKIVADELIVSSYMDVMSPTIDKLSPNNAIVEKDSINLSITKVEFARGETRVYVDVQNNTGASVSIKANEATISQGTTTHKMQRNFFGNYKELPAEIPGNTGVYGIVTFPAMEKKAMTFICNIGGQEFKIDIPEK